MEPGIYQQHGNWYYQFQHGRFFGAVFFLNLLLSISFPSGATFIKSIAHEKINGEEY